MASDLDSFTRAFNNTLGALEGATRAVTDLRTFEMSKFDGHDTVKAFVNAEALIKECFQSLNVSLVPFTGSTCMASIISHSAYNGMGREEDESI